eukprot:TRINITY_DN5332_c0_g1_i1.p1 TRINITY_DN5332_c0_g1~~TRINITY_DN5332_c0_g1_i1.p1  ORF type:complete len:208 (-),score=33.17 TRINITY_DN5332_c0_g1_i1:70-693(-)
MEIKIKPRAKKQFRKSKTALEGDDGPSVSSTLEVQRVKHEITKRQKGVDFTHTKKAVSKIGSHLSSRSTAVEEQEGVATNLNSFSKPTGKEVVDRQMLQYIETNMDSNIEFNDQEHHVDCSESLEKLKQLKSKLFENPDDEQKDSDDKMLTSRSDMGLPKEMALPFMSSVPETPKGPKVRRRETLKSVASKMSIDSDRVQASRFMMV